MTEVADLRARLVSLEEEYGYLQEALQSALAANEQLASAIIPGDLVSRFVVPALHVVPKERPRQGLDRRGRKMWYTPSKTKEAEAVVRGLALQGRVVPGPVDADHGFAVHVDLYGSRADIDNVGKMIMDGLQRGLFANDSQVRELLVRQHDGPKQARVSVYRMR